MRIAIVGTGIAGLATAWLLNRRHSDHGLRGRGARPGGMPIPSPSGRGRRRIRRYRLYGLQRTHLPAADPAVRPSGRCRPSRPRCRSRPASATAPWSMAAVRSARCWPSAATCCGRAFLRMLLDIRRFNRVGRRYLREQPEDRARWASSWSGTVSARAWPSGICCRWQRPSGRHRSPAMLDYPAHSFLSSSPTMACSASAASMPGEPSPAARASMSSGWWRNSGPRSAWRRRSQPCAAGHGAWRSLTGGASAAASIMSCWPAMPTRPWPFWTTPAPRERALLGAFRYQPNRAVLHRDARLMPRRRAVWSSWNYLRRATVGPRRRPCPSPTG